MENNDFKIFTDSSCDISIAELESIGIGVISYFVNTGGEEYYREGREITASEFYEKIALSDNMPKTSMPNVAAYSAEFRTALESGRDALCLTLTSKFSSSFNSANMAKNELLNEFPGRKTEVVDTRSCAALQGLIVKEAKKLKDAGFSLEETVSELKRIVMGQKIYFTVDSLKHLQKGGRIGKVNAFAGALLNIKPIIILLDGELVPLSKIRGRKKTLHEIIELFDEDIKDKKEEYLIGLLHSQCLEEAALVMEELRERGYDPYGPIEIGPTIGAHIGPTVIGIGYLPKSKASK